MENPYLKQYPDLMANKTILYVHGFLSSAQSGTVQLLRTFMPQARIVAEDIPIHPAEAMALLQRLCQEYTPDLIIGSSMGGMYTEMLRGYDRILVNPALRMGDTMSSMMGKQTFQNVRQDGVQELMVTKGLIKEYKDITTQCFEGLTAEDNRHVWGLFGDKDPIVHTFDLFSEHYSQAIHFHGEHRLVDKVVDHYLIPIIRWIDDRQQHRERPIVYIDYEALHDAYGHPTSSMHKAYELLLTYYQVYIVAPSLSNHMEQMAEVGAWVEEYLSAPAWNHVVYTDRKALLYGDYFIDPQPDTDFMGTTLAYGSDEFKSWEDIIVYFERLGGQ